MWAVVVVVSGAVGGLECGVDVDRAPAPAPAPPTSGGCPSGYYCGSGEIGHGYNVEDVYGVSTSSSIVLVDGVGVVIGGVSGSGNGTNNGSFQFFSGSASLFTGPTSTRPVASGPGGVCDCHGSQIEWRSLRLPVSSASATSFLAGISADAGKRCTFVTVGYSWSVAGYDTDPIVLTIPPGEFVGVTLGGASLNALSLNRGNTLNGQPCGRVFQDPLQGLVHDDGTSGDAVLVLPSSVPSTLYCGVGSGNGTTRTHSRGRFYDGFILRHLAVVDGVCRCRLGMTGAMFEMSGVYFVSNPLATNGYSGGPSGILLDGPNKFDLIRTTFGYTEALTNKHPRTFACRQDYTTYWLLVQFALASGKSIVETSCGGCGLLSTMWTAYVGIPETRLYYAMYGLWYAPGSSTAWSNFQTQDMFSAAVVHLLMDNLCPSPCTLGDLFAISSPDGFVRRFGTSGNTAIAAMTEMCRASTTLGGPMCIPPSEPTELALYFYNVVVETIAFFMRLVAYRSADAGTLTGYLTAFEAEIPLPTGHVLGSLCDARELMSEWRVRETVPVTWASSHVWSKTANFTFFRGGLPQTRLTDLAGATYDSVSGWPSMCRVCYYAGECVPTGGTCCSGATVGTSSISCPFVCRGPTDGSCTGYPIVSRHTETNSPTPPGTGSNDLATCDGASYTKAVLDGTPPSTSSTPLCLSYWTQPVKTSFFVDTSKLGSFYDDVGPATFFSRLITFYSLSLPQVFDPKGSWLFGQPTFKLFSDLELRTMPKTFPFLEEDETTPFVTLDLTYERFSGDLTHREATRVSPAWESRMESGECLGGACYNALDSATITTMRDTIGNRTLFQGNGWLFGDGLSLVSALGRFLPQTQSKFFETHLYNGRGASTEADGLTTTTTGCKNSDRCAVVHGYTVSGTACTVVTATIESYADCCAHCLGTTSLECQFWGYSNKNRQCTMCQALGTIVQTDDSQSMVGTPYQWYLQKFPIASAAVGPTACLAYCENGATTPTPLPRPAQLLPCTCASFTTSAPFWCELYFGETTRGATYTTTVTSMIWRYRVSGSATRPTLGYSTSMGLASGVPAGLPGQPSTAITFLGSSFDYAMLYGTVGPVPVAYPNPSRTYGPYDLSGPSPAPLSRFGTVYGLVSLVVHDDLSTIGAVVGGLGTTAVPSGLLGWTLSSGLGLCEDGATHCIRCLSDYTPSVVVPPWKWPHDCSVVDRLSTLVPAATHLIGTGIALEQSLSVLRDAEPVTLGYTVSLTEKPHEWFSEAGVPEISKQVLLHGSTTITFCWESSRGVVGDVSESFGGVCMGAARCYWRRREVYAMGASDHTTEIGCGTGPTFPGDGASVLVHDTGGIEWSTVLTAAPTSPPNPPGPPVPPAPPGSWSCMIWTDESQTIRQCTFDAVESGNYPRMLTSLSSAVLTALPIGIGPIIPISSSSVDLVSRLCGCSSYPTGATTLCRQATSTACVSCTTGGPEIYRCGSVIAPPAAAISRSPHPLSLTRLCSGCPHGQFGQCATIVGSTTGIRLKSCASYDWTTGACPSAGPDGLPYYFCASEISGVSTYAANIPVSGTTGDPETTTLFELTSANPADWMYYNVDTTYGFWYDLAPIRVMWSLTNYPHVIDGVHCAPIGPDGLVLEQPRYLAPPPDPIPATAPVSTPPSGLTTEELTGWCGWSTSGKTCSLRSADGTLPSRARLCTWNTTSNACEFRTILQKDYDVYAPGKAMFKSTTHPVVYPTCFLWVPGVDPVSECSSPREFTGCVLSSTSMTDAAHLSTGTFNRPTNASTSLFFPLTSTNYVMNSGYDPTPKTRILIYTLSGLVLRSATKTNLPAGTTLGYWAPTGEIMWRDLTPAELVLAPISGDPGYYSLTLNPTLDVLGLPYLDTDTVHANMHDLRGVDVGARASLRGLPGGVAHVGFQSTATTTYAQLSTSQLSRLLTTCVPLTFRVSLTSDNANDLIASNIVYRRRPIDCAMLSSNQETMSQPEIAALFDTGGACDSRSASQLGYLTGSNEDSIATATNVRFFTWWYSLLSGLDTDATNDGYIFYDSIGSLTTRLGLDPVVDLQAEFSKTGSSPDSSWTIGALPSCTATPIVSSCGVSIDRTALVPCVSIASTVVPSCQKPTMWNLYPRYAASDPTADSGEFSYPVQLMKSGTSYANPKAAGSTLLQSPQSVWWHGPSWNIYTAMPHYCDFYFASSQNGDAGMPIYCDNDPFQLQDRVRFCSRFQPQFVFAGMVLDKLELEDLCPFLNSNVPNSGAFEYCLVFADHPTFRSVQSLLSNRLPNGLDWSGKKFYYVPFTYAVMTNILTLASVADTLISNHADSGTFTRLTSANFRNFGPAGALIFEKLAGVVGMDKSKMDAIDRVCRSSEPITLETLQLVYDVIVASGSGDTYTFIELVGTQTTELASKTMTASQVWGVFWESSTRLQYNDVEVTTAIPGIRAVVGIPDEAVANQVPTCTRFQVDGIRVSIHGISFNQSRCKLVDVLSQTPIVFSGAYATQSTVYDIHVIDSSAAVVVLGGNSIVYTFHPLIDANGLLIHDVSFEYSHNTSVPIFDQYVVAMFAKTLGVPVVSACPPVTLPTGWTILSNCVWLLSDHDLMGSGESACTQSNTCLTPDAATCCAPDDTIVRDYECTTTYKCFSPALPNNRVMCNVAGCNCAQSSDCVDFASTLFPKCVDGPWEYVLSTLENVAVIQEYQYFSNSVWYTPTESYYNTYYGEMVQLVRGVGYVNTMLCVTGNPLLSLTTAGIGTTTFSTTFPVTDPYAAATIVPSDAFDADGTSWEYAASVQLVVDFDRVIASSVYRDSTKFSRLAQTDIGTIQWCVGVMFNVSTRLILQECSVSSIRWYVDPVTYRIHASETPDLCITSTPTSGVHLLPCRPCAIGSEAANSGAAPFDPAEVQSTSVFEFGINDAGVVVNATALTDPQAVYPLPALSDDTVFMLEDGTPNTLSLGYLVNLALGKCWMANATSASTIWHPHCVMRTPKSPTVELRGVFQTLSTKGLGGPLYNVVWDDPACVCGTGPCPVSTSIVGLDGHGIGAVGLVYANGSTTIQSGGYGYTSSTLVGVGACTGRAVTVRVLIEPIGPEEFDIETSGLELVNVTSYTGRYGGGHTYDASASHVTLSQMLEFVVVFLSFLCLFAFAVNIVFIVYRWVLTKRIVQSLNHAKSD